MQYTEKDFVGSWKTDQRSPHAPLQDGDVTIDFKSDRTAKYVIYYPDRRDVVELTFIVDGDEIITTQNNSRPLRTKFLFEKDGSLLLWFGGVKGRFLRQ